MAIESVAYFVTQRTTTRGESDADDVMKALADRQRRQTLRVLRDADGVVSLADLADEVTRREQAGEGDAPTDRKRIKLALYHVHLPKLADAGLDTIMDSDEWTRLIFTAEPERKALLSDLLALEET